MAASRAASMSRSRCPKVSVTKVCSAVKMEKSHGFTRVHNLATTYQLRQSLLYLAAKVLDRVQEAEWVLDRRAESVREEEAMLEVEVLDRVKEAEWVLDRAAGLVLEEGAMLEVEIWRSEVGTL